MINDQETQTVDQTQKSDFGAQLMFGNRIFLTRTRNFGAHSLNEKSTTLMFRTQRFARDQWRVLLGRKDPLLRFIIWDPKASKKSFLFH